MNKPIYLDKSILDISKTLMYEFSYDYIKPKHQGKAKLGTLLFILKLKIFTKTLLLMLKNGLTHLTMIKMTKNRFQQVKTRK